MSDVLQMYLYFYSRVGNYNYRYNNVSNLNIFLNRTIVQFIQLMTDQGRL